MGEEVVVKDGSTRSGDGASGGNFSDMEELDIEVLCSPTPNVLNTSVEHSKELGGHDVNDRQAG